MGALSPSTVPLTSVVLQPFQTREGVDLACYDGDQVVFTTYMDANADHCRQWYPECTVPGICPLPPEWRDPVPDAGPADAATHGSDISDASSDVFTPADGAVFTSGP